MIETSRRNFLVGFGSLIAVPAVVRATSLMPVRAIPALIPMGSNSLLTIDMITREAIKLFVNSNEFLQNIDRQFDDRYKNGGYHGVGSQLRIRLPRDYNVPRRAA